ncbi:MAG: 50S ribosomal protein L14 [Elusimicrobia bacterium]|nr:50S ribosomal protein L14 [Elusimicrobiota bacterium]
MIQQESVLNATDNSGAKKILCIRVLGGTKKRYGRVGDIIICSVKDAMPSSGVTKGEIVRAVIVRTKASIRRKDGTVVRFDDNGAVLLDNNDQPRGTRVFGPIAMELRDKNFTRIISLAPEVV